MSGLSTELGSPTGAEPSAPLATRPAGAGARRALASFAALFPRNAACDLVATTARFDAPPDAVWRGMRFYEDVPGTPPWILRVFVPRPVRTEGSKSVAGSLVQCTYEGGDLVKRITEVDAPNRVAFEVLEQRLGIEAAITMVGGSYELRAVAGGTEVVLTTRYHGHVRPRWLARPFERHLAHRLHRHILEGMRPVVAALAAPST